MEYGQQGQGHSDASEQAQRNEALLAVGETVILESKCHAFKNARGIQEVKPMGFDAR